MVFHFSAVNGYGYEYFVFKSSSSLKAFLAQPSFPLYLLTPAFMHFCSISHTQSTILSTIKVVAQWIAFTLESISGVETEARSSVRCASWAGFGVQFGQQ